MSTSSHEFPTGPIGGRSNPSVARPGYLPYPPGEGAHAYSRTPCWNEGSLAYYVAILSRRRGKLICSALCGALVALSISQILTPVYRARALVEIQNLNDDFLNTRRVTPMESSSPFHPPEYNVRTQTIILKSRPVLERAISKAGLRDRLLVATGRDDAPDDERIPEWNEARLHEQAIAVISESLKVQSEPNTRVIQVTFDSADPGLAADVANSVAAAFQEQSLEQRWQSSQETAKWLGRQVEDVKAKLEKAEFTLQKYASEADLTILSEREDASEERLRQVQAELSRAQADRIAKQSTYELVADASPETLAQVQDDPALTEYNVQLTTLRRQLAALSSLFTPEYPKVIDTQAQIQAVEAELEKKRSSIVNRILNDYTAAARREKLLEEDYARQIAAVSNQAGKFARYSILKREVDANRQLYDSLIQRVREAGLASAMQASEIRVIEAAIPPRFSHSPNVMLNTMLGLGAGLAFGSAFLVYRARSYSGIAEPGQLSVELDMPELGVIPASGGKLSQGRRLLGKPGAAARSRTDDAGPELATWQQWPSVIGESFRFVLTSILLSRNDGRSPRTIALTSANPGEGKTTVCSNLAIALARVDRRVLLIDGDIRRPRLHTVFGVENKVGFCEALDGRADPTIQETKIPNLFLLPSGRRADERVLFTAGLPRLLHRIKDDFDMILIDTPPVSQMSDARLMGHHADAVVLVVAQHTPREVVFRVRQRMAADGTRLLGTILNNWNAKDSAGYTSLRTCTYR